MTSVTNGSRNRSVCTVFSAIALFSMFSRPCSVLTLEVWQILLKMAQVGSSCVCSVYLHWVSRFSQIHGQMRPAGHGLRGLTQPLECKHARNPTLSTSGCTCLSSQLHTDTLLWPSVVTSAQPLNSTSPSLNFLMSSVWVGLFSMRFPVWKVTFSQTGPVKLGISC